MFFDNLSLLNAHESTGIAQSLVGYFWSDPIQIASPLGGFGLNFDIIETNILNLGVVIGVVLYLGGDVLTLLLNDRKQKILGTLKIIVNEVR